ncbi:MAG: threonine synthase, partial [Thaumarchaeota archaeon]|nr:threonine synthase [Nitrososphaerota archaeon]
STGNTSASLAAYAARAGVKAAVVVPSGKVAAGKLSQAVAYGANILRTDGNFDRALNLTIEIVSELPSLYLMNSVNPYRIEGQKTVAFEIYQQLGFVCPDYVVLPVGNAGNISAVWKGFKELKEWGMMSRLPVLVGVQASGASPIVDAYERGSQEISPVDEPKTVASAIRIGNPVSWRKAANALRESNGMALAVSDEEIIQAREDLASDEGIFVEPASATPIAALRRLGGKVERGSTVVCIATGHGLKDQDSVHWNAEESPVIGDKSSLKSELGRLSIN